MKIIIIGDVMLDINHECNTTRIAPEAPIPVYNVINTNYILGGAGNVAVNLTNLETNVELITVVGEDEMGDKLQSILSSKNIRNKVFTDKRITTVKTRIFHDKKLVNRYDQETIEPINVLLEIAIINYITSKIGDIDAIILSDYNKGVITVDLCKQIIDLSQKHNVYTFIDPKIKNIHKYANCFCIKPNMTEAQQMTDETNISAIFDKLYSCINPQNIIITNGEHGMYVNSANNHATICDKVDVVDVTGAGDIALCIIVYIWLKEKDMYLATQIANKICSKSVGVVGNYQLTLHDIYNYYIENKVVYDTEPAKLLYLNKLKEDKKIVFTNGCFDIIHSAHIKLLQFCKKQGDILIVGLNSDNSIRQLKGETRPINEINERVELLANLGIVDYIVVFNELTPLTILKHICPHVLVKGGDYNIETIVGKEYCNEIKFFNYIYGKSSTNVVNKINYYSANK